MSGTAVVPVAAARQGTARSPVLRPNLFAIPFGFAGLAGCWSVAAPLTRAPGWVVTGWWALTAAVLVAVGVPYLVQVRHQRRFVGEAADPTFGPYLALPPTLVMLLGVALAGHAAGAGRTVYALGLVGTVAVGALLSGQWLRGDVPLQRWHPGYLLPTVAGGLVASLGAATLGLPRLAGLMFGYGVVCWLILSSIVLARLVSGPALPLALRPTLAIEVAPPAVALNAWFALDGHRLDLVALVLTGFGLLMVAVQLRLAAFLLAAPFGPGTWAFSFTYAQVLVAGLHWLQVTHPPARAAWAWLVVAVATAGLAVLVGRSAVGLLRGTFLPRPESR